MCIYKDAWLNFGMKRCYGWKYGQSWKNNGTSTREQMNKIFTGNLIQRNLFRPVVHELHQSNAPSIESQKQPRFILSTFSDSNEILNSDEILNNWFGEA